MYCKLTMSTYDEDEALFEDIYDEDTKVETKSSEQPPQVEQTSASTAPDTEAKSETGSAESAPPPPPPPSESANAEQLPAPQAEAPQQQHQSAPYDPQPQQVPNQFTPGQLYQQYPQQGGYQQPQQPQQPQYQQPPQPQEPNRMPPSSIGKESGKMFIGGLNWDTTEEGLVSYFSKYGEISDYTIMKDPSTGRSRGFGFLTFKDPRAVEEVIRKDHILDGKLIDPKRAIAREEQDKVGKIFVGGIDPLVNEKDFHDFFSQYGRIIDAQLMIDKDTGRSRGFGFITFDSPDAVDRVCVNKYLTLKGKAMEVKRAEPRGLHQQNHLNQGYHQQQQQPQQQQQQYNPYGQFPMQMPGAGSMPGFQGATPEMMQEYWQRMQWYMFQQQQAAAQGDNTQQPVQQPLNPQEQAAEQEVGNDESESGAGNDNGRERSYDGGDGDRRENHRDRRRGPNDRTPPSGPSGDNGDGRRMNLPKGPKRAPPAGPSSGRGRGGYRSRGGYHPYGKKGRR